jgi:hypothetical protein
MQKNGLRLSAKELRERELAQYMADMLLEMRNLAKGAGFNTLLSLLEISYCEAFALANKVEVPEGEIQRLRELSAASGRAAG